MTFKLIGMVLLLLSSTGLGAQELPFCQKGANTPECQHYIAGVVDGALLYAPKVGVITLGTEDFEARALKFRAGNRYKKAQLAHCSHSTDEASVIAAAVEEQLALNTITNLEELKLFLDTVLKCNVN
ncbi:hypothetical protein [Shewanella sp. SR44-3]|uniref:hypothetical protein n=1 Tax=unclassified Shewanella TaxID=196818 RepID=UPI0015F84E88|nr:hypothetical protein [Shewanella sp. SR44-3]MBB1269829.1 hypothetical protein [Shewanella sp. SR44-3]